jgi:hypothetical protein
VIELRFHKTVYAGTAVDAAMKQVARFAGLEAVDDATHWVVRVTSKSPARERSVAGELSNHALAASAAARGGGGR